MFIIKSNKAKCLTCGDVIESKHLHDFVSCSCGKLAVDGGLAYIKRCWSEPFEEMSEQEERGEEKDEGPSR